MRKKTLYDLSAELGGVAMIIVGLSNQLDNTKCDALTTENLGIALFGISNHLQRISNELEEME